MHTSAALRVPSRSHHPQLEHFMPLYSLQASKFLPPPKVVFPHLPFSGQSLAMVFINSSSMFGSLAQAVIRVVAVLCVVFFRAQVASSASSSHLHRLHHASCRPGPACSSPSSSLPRVCAGLGHRDCQCVGQAGASDVAQGRGVRHGRVVVLFKFKLHYRTRALPVHLQCQWHCHSGSLRFFLSAESPTGNRSLYCLLLYEDYLWVQVSLGNAMKAKQTSS
jgi:hypothetical protein